MRARSRWQGRGERKQRTAAVTDVTAGRRQQVAWDPSSGGFSGSAAHRIHERTPSSEQGQSWQWPQRNPKPM